jgi:hypothetical protein
MRQMANKEMENLSPGSKWRRDRSRVHQNRTLMTATRLSVMARFYTP